MDTTTTITVVDAARRALGPVGAFLPVTFTDTPAVDQNATRWQARTRRLPHHLDERGASVRTP